MNTNEEALSDSQLERMRHALAKFDKKCALLKEGLTEMDISLLPWTDVRGEGSLRLEGTGSNHVNVEAPNYAKSVVYSRRVRAQQTAEREAAGESLWVEAFDERSCRRLAAAWELLRENEPRKGWEVSSAAASMMTREGGWQMGQFLEESHLAEAHARRSKEWILDALDCIHAVLTRNSETWQTRVNLILNEHRIAFRMVEGQIVAVSSDELHQEVVEPALRLLLASNFQTAHDAYLKALEEITNNDAGDAITDAATALQETLVALGCTGNALGPLLKSARQQGLLGSHDQLLTDGIAKFVDWASAERSNTGDAHSHSEAPLSDAWLMVHIVGALIVRLAAPERRGI